MTMRFSPTGWLNAISIAGIGAMMFAAGSGMSQNGLPVGVDPITTASVPASRPLQANQYVAIDHRTNRSCVLSLHRADGYDVHRIEPGATCADMSELFVRARAWQENQRGRVVITDHRGQPLMRLAPSDGFAWDVIEPRNLEITLAAY